MDFEVSKIGTNPDHELSEKFPIQIQGSRAGQSVCASYILTCAGLQSDRVAEFSGE